MIHLLDLIVVVDVVDRCIGTHINFLQVSSAQALRTVRMITAKAKPMQRPGGPGPARRQTESGCTCTSPLVAPRAAGRLPGRAGGGLAASGTSSSQQKPAQLTPLFPKNCEIPTTHTTCNALTVLMPISSMEVLGSSSIFLTMNTKIQSINGKAPKPSLEKHTTTRLAFRLFLFDPLTHDVTLTQ